MENLPYYLKKYTAVIFTHADGNDDEDPILASAQDAPAPRYVHAAAYVDMREENVSAFGEGLDPGTYEPGGTYLILRSGETLTLFEPLEKILADYQSTRARSLEHPIKSPLGFSLS